VGKDEQDGVQLFGAIDDLKVAALYYGEAYLSAAGSRCRRH
jgi:hypothetical protein